MANNQLDSLLEEVIKAKKYYMDKLKELSEAAGKEFRPSKKQTSDKKSNESGKSMKDIVLNIVSSSENGILLKDIVLAVKKIIDNGEYSTTSDNIPNLVSQALNKLEKTDLVNAAKHPETNRKVYSVAKALAA